MQIVIDVFAVLVALEFFFIMYLETFATTSKRTAKVFNMSREVLAQKEVNTLFKNQGVYNGLIGLGLIYGVAFQPALIVPLLVFIVAVAAYGAFSSQPKILLTQGGLAIITLVLCIVQVLVF